MTPFSWLLHKIHAFAKRESDHKLADLLLYFECSFYYLLWCIRYPRLCAHRFFIGRGSRLVLGSKASLQFGKDVYFMANFGGDFSGNVILGNNVRFQPNCRVTVHEELRIGEYTGFAEGVSIHDETHLITGGSDPYFRRPLITQPIVIGRNVWVGAKVTILQGVTIGDNAVIGAHSLVKSDIPAYAIAVGTPARVIRMIEPENATVLSEMLEIRAP